MGIFSKKATDVELAYESKQSTGLCLVLGSGRATSLSNYEEHKPALRNILNSEQQSDGDTVVVPVLVRIDFRSPYKDSLGVYFGKVQVGWVLKDEAVKFVEMIKADGRNGVGILGELFLDRGDVNKNVVFHELLVYA